MLCWTRIKRRVIRSTLVEVENKIDDCEYTRLRYGRRMTRLMSHACVGRSSELSYGIGEIGEGHITKNVIYRRAILVFGASSNSAASSPADD